MKSVVIYNLQTGFTKKYAEWIAYKLKCDIFPVKEISSKKMLEYDTVIYGGFLYAVGITGIKKIKNNMSKFSGKKIAIFDVGASPSSEKVYEKVKAKNFTSEELKKIKVFYMRGGFDFTKLSFLNKILMNMLKAMMLKKKERTPDEEGMISLCECPVDFTDKGRMLNLSNPDCSVLTETKSAI
ncbi:TPA: flavodoxin [candidate division WOR-3 bacterium]|jgi:menaquinone-dependent protoporphyrinogen IX oxidase|uniref:Flavodoxin n=1 Tax=candidate division WOR-3 bacterium TaxID=2052148 RepID=A0A350H7Z8_UNCW3|nr:flavodoxin [candidate division WOR-3 bacterium]